MDYKALMQAHERNLDDFEKETGLVGPGRDIPADAVETAKTNVQYRQGAWDVWILMLQKESCGTSIERHTREDK